MQDRQRTPGATPLPERQLRRSATLIVEVGELEAALDQVAALLREIGGYAEGTDASSKRARVRARVPAASFEAALGRFSDLGEERERSVRAEDVTEQLRDLDTRIENQRALVTRLRALFERGGSVEELLQVEKELARAQTELERLLGTRESLGRQVALSTIELTLIGPGESRWPGPGGVLLQAAGDLIEWFWRRPEGRILPFP